MDTKINSTIDSARAVSLPGSGRLTRPIAFIKGHSRVLAIIMLVVLGGALAFFWWSRKDSSGEYLTDKVTRGAIEVDVSATGTVQAVTTVQVGSQVSGAVAWLGADFKSSVTRGQVIAKLDPALFQAQVDTARANLMNAQAGVQAALTEIQNQTANVEAAKANDQANQAARDEAIEIAKQNEKLRGIIPDREIQSAQNGAKAAIARYGQATSQIGQARAQLQISQSKLKQAQAAVAQATAQLEQATVNLDHSIITSPIDGVVVSRNVDVGQTVAASLQAPTLFTIANDLTNMQVLASIDEADVGQVREGGKARFTVDAFPGQVFNGDVTQVRLNAQTLQNVVTYAAVITVSNPEQKLMPGMTANITLPISRREDVLRVPNGALRFKPELTDQQTKDVQAKIDAFRQQQQSQSANDGEQQKGQTEAAPQQPPTQISTPAPAGASADKAVHKRQDPSVDSGQKQPNKQGAGGNASGDNSKQRRQSSGQTDKAVAQQGDNQNTNADKTGGRHRGQQPQSGAAADTKQTPSPAPAQAAVNSQAASGGGRRSGGGQRQIQAVWVLTANKTLEARVVRTGITDGRFTEIMAGDLKEGDVIVTGQSDGSAAANSNKSPQTTTPFQQRPPGAGGGRGR